MRTMLDFMAHVLRMHPFWAGFVGLLVLANGIAPWFFFEAPEAKVILAVFAPSALAMILLFAKFGFVRLLGAGHFLWLGLVPWLIIRLDGIDSGSPLCVLVVAVIGVNGLSVTIDVIDVIRYARGDRAPAV